MFAQFNRKPLEYLKPAEVFASVNHVEVDGREQTIDLAVKDLWIGHTSEFRSDKKSAVATFSGDMDGKAVNLPGYMIPVVEEILSNESAVSSMKRGKCALVFYEYTNDHGTFIGVDFVDV